MNLTKVERQALKRLKTDENIVILPAYKEQSTVVMDKLKRPSHVKLMLANSCWQTQIGVCERHNMLANCWRKVGKNKAEFSLSPKVCQHVVVSFTHTNLSLPTRVGQR